MHEIDIIKLNSKGVCVAIKRMTLDEWKKYEKMPNYVYRAYQIGYHSFKINQ